MSWSWRVATVAGIPIRIHATFLILLAFIGGANLLREGPMGALGGVVFLLALFLCVALHELGHSLVALRFGIRVKDITLLPIGGVAQLESMPEEPKQEILISLAGPLVNVVIAASLAVGLQLRHLSPWSDLGVWTPNLLRNLLATNVLLAVFNLLPAFPMDGGRVLRATLAGRMPYARATRVAAWVGQGLAAVLALVGLFGNFFLLFIALFVYVGAQSEAAAVQFKEDLKGLTVRDVMVPLAEAIDSDETLGAVFARYGQGFRGELPVVEGREFRGVLTHPMLLAAAHDYPSETPASQLVTPPCSTISADEPLEALVPRFQTGECWAVGVVEGDALIGIATAEGVGQFLVARSALGPRTDS